MLAGLRSHTNLPIVSAAGSPGGYKLTRPLPRLGEVTEAVTRNGEVVQGVSPTIVVVGLEELPDWERLLAAESHLQALVPGTVLVGETAATLHAGHHRSLDGEHVLEGLRSRFADVLATLEEALVGRRECNDWAHLAARA